MSKFLKSSLPKASNFVASLAKNQIAKHKIANYKISKYQNKSAKLIALCKLSIASLAFLSFAQTTLYSQTKIDAKNSKSTSTTSKNDSLHFVLPSITVSSTKAIDRITPVPFVELDKMELAKSISDKDLPTYLSGTPSILTYSENGNGIGYSNLSLRGFDQRRIAVMINGIPQNDPEDHNVYWINFSDISESLENIQIQRGAGMINYGAAAIAGSINLNTLNYANKKFINIATGVGFQEFADINNGTISANSSKFKFEASSGLIDNKYAIYGKLSRINSFGYRNHSASFMNSYFLSAVRFDENITTQINIFGGSQYDELAYTGLPKAFITNSKLRRGNYSYWEYDSTYKNAQYLTATSKSTNEDFNQPHYEILNDWKISDNISIKSSLFFYTGEGYFDYSGDGWTNAGSYYLTKEYGFDSTTQDPKNPLIRAWVGNKHGGWIPRLVYSHDNGTLTAGAEIRTHRSDHWGKLIYAENLPSGYDKDRKFYEYKGERDIFSIFAREQYKINDEMIASVEGQLVSHTYRINNEKFGEKYSQYTSISNTIVGNGDDLFSMNYLFFNPRAGFVWNFEENQNVKIAIAYTSREPRMSNLYNASEAFSGNTPLFAGDTANGLRRYDFTKPLVKPEKMLDFEIGWQYKKDRNMFAANVYMMDYTDELVKSGNLDIFGNPIDGNAPKTSHIGLELEAKYTFKFINFLDDQFYVFLASNATFSRNRIVDFDYISKDGKTKISLKDNPIAAFPDAMANISIGTESENFYLALSGKYVGEFYTNNYGGMANTNELIRTEIGYVDNINPAFFIMNLAISYKMHDILGAEKIKVNAHINNLTNKIYSATGTGKDFFPAAERNFYFGIEYGL